MPEDIVGAERAVRPDIVNLGLEAARDLERAVLAHANRRTVLDERFGPSSNCSLFEASQARQSECAGRYRAMTDVDYGKAFLAGRGR